MLPCPLSSWSIELNGKQIRGFLFLISISKLEPGSSTLKGLSSMFVSIELSMGFWIASNWSYSLKILEVSDLVGRGRAFCQGELIFVSFFWLENVNFLEAY